LLHAFSAAHDIGLLAFDRDDFTDGLLPVETLNLGLDCCRCIVNIFAHGCDLMLHSFALCDAVVASCRADLSSI
jgi:hypothetical protein